MRDSPRGPTKDGDSSVEAMKLRGLKDTVVVPLSEVLVVALGGKGGNGGGEGGAAEGFGLRVKSNPGDSLLHPTPVKVSPVSCP
jgi:hypothetical protein